MRDFDYYIKQAMILSAAFAVTRKSRDGAPSTARRVTWDEDDDCQPGQPGYVPGPKRVQSFEEVAAARVPEAVVEAEAASASIAPASESRFSLRRLARWVAQRGR